MFVWSFPNIGNPLKVVRYEYEWYETLERILQLEPEALIPGHGQAIKDKNKIKEAFQDVIDALRYVHDETIKHINKGTDVNEAVRQVKLPKRLAESPYVQQIYGSVPFTVQGMYRRYTGWFDGNPSNLNPASKEAVAQEMLSLIDNDEAVLARSRALIKEGDNRLAMHLLDLLIFGKNNDEAIQLKKQAIQNEAEVSTNFIMRNIYRGLSK